MRSTGASTDLCLMDGTMATRQTLMNPIDDGFSLLLPFFLHSSVPCVKSHGAQRVARDTQPLHASMEDVEIAIQTHSTGYRMSPVSYTEPSKGFK
jgi:hypothetical protein